MSLMINGRFTLKFAKSKAKLLKLDEQNFRHSLDFLCILTLTTGQLDSLFHTFAEFTPVVHRVVAQQSTDWLAANAHFSA